MGKKLILLFAFITILLCVNIYQRTELENIKKIESGVNTNVMISSSVERSECNNIMSISCAVCLVSIFFISLLFLVIGQVQKIYLWKVELPVFWGAKYRIQSPRCKITNKYSNLFLDFL